MCFIFITCKVKYSSLYFNFDYYGLQAMKISFSVKFLKVMLIYRSILSWGSFTTNQLIC